MAQHMMEVNGKKYSFIDIPALHASRLLIRAQKYVVPSIAKGGEVTLAGIMSDLNEGVIDEVVIPLFASSQLVRLDDNRKINTNAMVDVCFPTSADLIDLIEVVKNMGEVLFGDFFEQLGSHFTEDFPSPQSPAVTRRKAK